MKQKITLLAALFFSLTNYAQLSNDGKNPQTPAPTPSRIKVYTPSSSAGTKNSDKKDNSYRWTAKTDVIAMLTGEFPIIGEYRFARKFSIEGSAAATYGFYSNDGLLSSGNNDFTGSGLLDDGGKAALGSAFRGTLKFYPSSDYDALEGWSFGLQLYTKTTNRDYTASQINTGNPSAIYTDSKTKNGASVIIAYQAFADSNITVEYFMGVGLASIDRDQPYEVYNQSTNEYDIKMQKTHDHQPNFQFGTRIGFGN